MVTTESNGISSVTARSVTIQTDGKIVVAGTSNGQFGLFRYTADGSLDQSFDGDGKVTTDFGIGSESASSVAIQNDGKIVVAGDSNGDFAVARYNADGSLDTSFDADGKLTTSIGSSADQARSIMIQDDGKIVVAGNTLNGSHHDFALVRYDSDGTLDVTFDGDGKLTTDFGASNDIPFSMALQANGKIVVVGYRDNPSGVVLAVARYNTDGSLDISFDGDGKLTTDFGNGNNYARDVAIQNDGKLVVAGDTFSGSSRDFTLARYNSDGSLDTSFDGDGKQTTNFDASDDFVSSVVLQADGKIVVAGVTNGVQGYDAALVRYKSDGSLDTSFGTGGKRRTDFGTSGDNVVGLALQTDGKIVVAGNIGSDQGIVLARFIDTVIDEPPTITSVGVTSIAENMSAVSNVVASDPEGRSPLYGIVGGADQSRFSLNFLTGALSFVSPPDFEHPTDANGDNVYEVQVAASDGMHLVTQNIDVTVTDVNETVTIPLPANGGNFKTLFLNGQLHLRSSLGKPLITPVTLPSGANVQFTGSNATDRLTLDRSWSRFTGRLTFNGNNGNDQLDARTVSLGVTFNGGEGNDTFLGGRGNDTANGGAGLDSLTGNDGNDSLMGGDGNDKLFGGADGDTLAGDAGTDSLSGGDDDDSLSGGDANDTLTGDAGNDTVTGDSGADSITGGDDDDLVVGGTGNDSIDGGRGEDVLDGGDDNDNLKGSDGNDSIRGGNGNDTLSGGNGDDLLTGSAGNDSLLGDAGTDTLLGDDGLDKLNGGLGTDTINGVVTGPSKDTISDTTRVIDTSFSYNFDALLAGLL